MIPNPKIVNIESISSTIFPPNPTLDNVLIILLSDILKALIYPTPNNQ